MAYTELTCDDQNLSTETLLRGAMKQLPDGSWTIQIVAISSYGDFNNDFSDDFNIQ